MKNTYVKIAAALCMVFMLSGCLYPDEELEKNKTPNQDQLETVQKAVDSYRDQTNGLVPIKTKPMDTPIYEKYIVDFTMLKERHLLTETPGNAYENGGIYQYVLVDPEKNPTVKLIDLRLSEAIRDVNVKLDLYRDKHLYPPFGKKITANIYTINYKKLGLPSEPYVTSPYSQKNLPIIMDTNGKLYVDYRIDLMDALQKYKHNYQNGDDIRAILVEHAPFVPAYSLPYTVKDGEPVFLEKSNRHASK
ncbi:hypothetical protein P5G51_010080 [Virgibacillus sp. 179-BFC.A HS]|uniref:Lipoprotein n=1 Tax=Tigheibacillus jepli TaxID=3035914 RepID=A0ABU5CH75_9BACI|nr:hypothetical protein [Virgibacillus sp. 179-BFC.A HS]MDY0405694.1 hypothetical protein [Virgibacillus sp. 179-BFC.A HS]